MSARGLIPVVLAVGFGIANGQSRTNTSLGLHQTDTIYVGYVVFNPAFQEREVEKMHKQTYVKIEI